MDWFGSVSGVFRECFGSVSGVFRECFGSEPAGPIVTVCRPSGILSALCHKIRRNIISPIYRRRSRIGCQARRLSMPITSTPELRRSRPSIGHAPTGGPI